MTPQRNRTPRYSLGLICYGRGGLQPLNFSRGWESQDGRIFSGGVGGCFYSFCKFWTSFYRAVGSKAVGGRGISPD